MKDIDRKIVVHENGFAVTFLWSGEKVARIDVRQAAAPRIAGKADAPRERRWTKQFFAGKFPADIPLDVSVLTSFQRKVFGIVTAIPAGRTLTYGEVARRAGKPLAARAVGQALRSNPHSLFMPCHRVVASGGGLGGYGGKMNSSVKKTLLLWESKIQSRS